MEPEPEMLAVESVDLSPLAPPHSDAVYARVTARAMELRKLRRAVVRRGVIAVVLATAAAIVFWLSAPPRHEPVREMPAHDVLDLGMRVHVDPYELLELGGSHAQ